MILEVTNLRKHYRQRAGIFPALRSRERFIPAVDGVSFCLEEHETVGLVGESGSGKTTIGRAILKLTPATSGQALLNGRDILPLNEDEFRPLRREVQMIFQDPFGSLNPRHTIFQIIGEALEIHFPAMSKMQREQRVA